MTKKEKRKNKDANFSKRNSHIRVAEHGYWFILRINKQSDQDNDYYKNGNSKEVFLIILKVEVIFGLFTYRNVGVDFFHYF